MKIRSWYRILCLLAVICPLLLPAKTSRYISWNTDDGLPQNSISRMLQDRNGYVWLGTYGGLVRFDGVRFHVFNVAGYPQMTSNRVICLVEDRPRKRLLMHTNTGGLMVVKDDQITVVAVPGLRPEHILLNILVDKQGRIWLSTDTGTWVLDGATFQPLNEFSALTKSPSFEVFQVADDAFLLMHEKVQLFEKGRLRAAGENYFRGLTATGATIYDHELQTFWQLSGDKLQQVTRHGVQESYVLPEAVYKSLHHPRLHYAGHHSMLLTSTTSASVVRFNTWTRRFEALPSLDDHYDAGSIKDVLVDVEGNTWYGTSLAGVLMERPNSFAYADTSRQISNHNIYAVIRDSRDRIWMGTNGNGLYIIDGPKVRNISQNNSRLKSSPFVTSILEASVGEYYVAMNAGLYRILDNGSPQISMLSEDEQVRALYRCNNGQLLAGSNTGVYSLTPGGLVPHVLTAYIKDAVSTFFEDRDHRLWMTTGSGIHSYANGQYHLYSKDIGLSGGSFRGIGQDRQGTMYFGSYGYGLFVLYKGRFHRLDMKMGLKDDVVSTITPDNHGNLWLTGNYGLSRLKLDDVYACLEGRSNHVNAILYNRKDGLASSEFNGGVQQSACRISDDVYLFPTSAGCVKIDFSSLVVNKVPPPVHIETVGFNDSIYHPSGTLKLHYAEGRMELAFTALSYTSPGNVLFRYKMEGYDKGWIDAGPDRKTVYTNLPPGAYTFHVTACNNDGVWNNTGSRLHIIIIPPFYMEWWFRILMGLLAAGLITLIIFFIIRSAVRRNANRTAFMNVLPDLLLRLNKQGKYIDFLGNKEPLPVPFGQMKGKFPSDILPEKLATLIDHHHNLALNTQTLQVFDYTDVQMDGRAIDYEGRMISVNRSEVLYIIRDVTERKKAEREVQRNQAELLELLDQKNELIRENKRQQMERLYAIVETQETERQRVANDLHDGIAQMLSLIKINLSAIDDGQDNKERQQQVIDATQKLVDSINADLRNISHNLMPASLSRFGLIPALKELAERMQHNKQLNFRFSSHTANQHFDPMIDVNIYRIVQELINNTIKHGRASHILLQVLEHEDSIALTFENDGISYDPVTGENKHESRGLKNILTRVRTMNGMIQFDTAVSGEIVVTLEVPLPAQHPPKTNTYG